MKRIKRMLELVLIRWFRIKSPSLQFVSGLKDIPDMSYKELGKKAGRDADGKGYSIPA